MDQIDIMEMLRTKLTYDIKDSDQFCNLPFIVQLTICVF